MIPSLYSFLLKNYIFKLLIFCFVYIYFFGIQTTSRPNGSVQMAASICHILVFLGSVIAKVFVEMLIEYLC